MLEKFKQINTLWFLPVLLLVHLWSMAGIVWPVLNLAGFVALVVLCVVLALVDMRLAIVLFVLELIIGSKGYIFSLDLGGLSLSLRIALWLVIMAVWSAKFVLNFKSSWETLKKILWSSAGKYYLALLAACLVSVVIGLLKNNSANLFFDANNWVFLLIALPLWFNFQTREDLLLLKKTFVIGVSWLVFATLLIAYIFSHDLGVASVATYNWLRHTGLAEITWTPNGFWRVFLQSHIYLVFATLGLGLLGAREALVKKDYFKIVLQSALVLAALFFSLSRSLWLGLLVALAMMLVLAPAVGVKITKLLKISTISLVASYLVVWLVLTTAFNGGSSSFDALLDRANISTEAAASSRWNLLPVIWEKIKINPILGSGFGATVVYQSKDPRILEKDASGTYETYAFEWGWLDLWLKLGLWGVLIYLVWLVTMIIALLKLRTLEATCLAVSLLALMVIHFFTPYLNHPLGLIVVIVAAQALRIWQENNLEVKS